MLQDGILIPKHHPIIKALAALDELNAHLGQVGSEFEEIQKNIMKAMSLISTTSKNHKSIIQTDYFQEETKALEQNIDHYTSMMPRQTSFVTYGNCPKSTSLDLARAVARRAETYLSKAAEVSDYALWVFPYINRLSDFLYVMARYTDFEFSIVQAVQDAIGGQPQELNLASAKAIIEKIEYKAKDINLPVVVACCDAGGNPIAVHVMDGALLVSYEAAIAKAYTAAALKMPTADTSKLVQPGQPFYGLESLGGGKILPIGGGIPIFNNQGHLLGAIGVSGGTAQQDHELALIGRSIHSAS
ncbi:MAG: ATP:cob(I)alamin adenosyltransferase [Defluviitaleaceae bacterium]|nr:ATP:cob(I)alamin adenosyltransferase [Defluviitaleaceae bacterium]